MKSVFLSFLMFLVLFAFLKTGLFSFLNCSWFTAVSLVIFIIIIGIAVFMFGLPTKQDFKKALKIKGKEARDEKDD